MSCHQPNMIASYAVPQSYCTITGAWRYVVRIGVKLDNLSWEITQRYNNKVQIKLLFMTYIHIWEMSCKDSEWLMLVCGPETSCTIMRTSGKVVTMRSKSDTPYREAMTFVAH